MRLIRDRQGSQHEFSHQEFRNTERSSIGKIREQYQDSLKVTKEFYTLEGRKMEDRYEQCFLDLSNKLQNYELKVI